MAMCASQEHGALAGNSTDISAEPEVSIRSARVTELIHTRFPNALYRTRSPLIDLEGGHSSLTRARTYRKHCCTVRQACTHKGAPLPGRQKGIRVLQRR